MPPSFCVFRIKNELESLQLLEGTSFTIEYDPIVITYNIKILSGIYKDKSFCFKIYFSIEYPFVSPKIKCLTPVYHPSIDSEGNTCLEILRLNWKCTYGIQNIFVNLYTIFLDLDCDVPLNDEVNKLMLEDWDEFIRRVKDT